MTQRSLKVENTQTQQYIKLFVLTTQASFVKFKTSNNKLGQERQLSQCYKDIMRSVIYYKIQITN